MTIQSKTIFFNLHGNDTCSIEGMSTIWGKVIRSVCLYINLTTSIIKKKQKQKQTKNSTKPIIVYFGSFGHHDHSFPS